VEEIAVSSQPILERLEERAATRALSFRTLVVSLLGPVTALAGVVWAIVQPYRITLLHPHGQSFWWLFVEPPLLVVLVGVAFHLLVARPLLEDMEKR
jgi:hypothetical protein